MWGGAFLVRPGGRLGRSRAREDGGYPDDRAAAFPGVLLSGRGGNTLATVHADPHLGRYLSRRGKARPRRRGRIAGGRQIW